MNYYKLTFNEVPKIHFIHNYSSGKYNNFSNLSNIGDFITYGILSSPVPAQIGDSEVLQVTYNSTGDTASGWQEGGVGFNVNNHELRNQIYELINRTDYITVDIIIPDVPEINPSSFHYRFMAGPVMAAATDDWKIIERRTEWNQPDYMSASAPVKEQMDGSDYYRVTLTISLRDFDEPGFLLINEPWAFKYFKIDVIGMQTDYNGPIYVDKILSARDIFEISYEEEAALLRNSPQNHDTDVKNDDNHNRFTVSFSKFAQQEIISGDIIAFYKNGIQSQWDKNIFFAVLPEIITDEKTVKDAAVLIKLIISKNNSASPVKNISVTAILFDILRIITEYSFGQMMTDLGVSFSDLNYCEKAISLIKSNLNKKFNVEEIAAELKISSAHLSRIFKKNTGRTIIDYINQHKIERAQILIASGNMAVQDIALQAGISDIKYFYNLFKKYAKMTVSEYRELKCITK